MRKKQNIIRPMLTHQTVARRRFTAEIKKDINQTIMSTTD